MNITWHGQTCFKITSQKSKNESVTILIDPPEKEAGLRSPRLEADILVSTLNKKILGEGFLIFGPGEYEIKEVYINGIPFSETNTVYTIEAEGIKICHLGLLGQAELKSEQLESISDIDILMVPVGGGRALDSKSAAKVMSQIEPKIIIPMYYKIPKLKEKLDGLDKFLKNLGIKSLQTLPKLSIKKKDIPQEEVKIIVLNP